MSTVTPASNSKYFSGRGQGSAEIREGEDQTKRQVVLGTVFEPPVAEGDNLDLSRSTQDLLDEMRMRAEKIVEEHPEYRHLLFGSKSAAPGQEGVLVLSRAQSIVRNPHYQAMTKQNAQFGEFYTKVEQLGAHAQHLLQSLRAHLKSEGTATYSRPSKT